MPENTSGALLSRTELLLVSATRVHRGADGSVSQLEPGLLVQFVIMADCLCGRAIHLTEKELAKGSLLCGECVGLFKASIP
jgi:hypothetical protein